MTKKLRIVVAILSGCFLTAGIVLPNIEKNHIHDAIVIADISHYNQVENFSEGLALVGKKVGDSYKYGFIDIAGNEVVPTMYDKAYSFSDGLALVARDVDNDEDTGNYNGLEWGFIDSTGTEIIPLVYNAAGSFSEDLATVRDGYYWGYIDVQGNMVVPFLYVTEVSNYAGTSNAFSEGVAVIITNDGLFKYKYGTVNNTGEEVISPIYDDMRSYKEGLASFGIDIDSHEETGDYSSDLWGFVDKSGIEVISPIYSATGDFSCGLAAVGKDIDNNEETGDYHGLEWGFIDINGNEVIPIQYDTVENFENGYAHVYTKSDGYFYIYSTGKVAYPLAEEMYSFSEGLCAIQVGEKISESKWEFIDENNEEIIPALYDYSYGGTPEFHDGRAIVSLGDLTYVIQNPLLLDDSEVMYPIANFAEIFCFIGVSGLIALFIEWRILPCIKRRKNTQSESAVCSSCGNKLKQNAKFCSSCGQKQ